MPATSLVKMFHKDHSAQFFTSNDVDDPEFVDYIKDLLPFYSLEEELSNYDKLKFKSSDDDRSETSTQASFIGHEQTKSTD